MTSFNVYRLYKSLNPHSQKGDKFIEVLRSELVAI